MTVALNRHQTLCVVRVFVRVSVLCCRVFVRACVRVVPPLMFDPERRSVRWQQEHRVVVFFFSSLPRLSPTVHR